MIRWLKRYANAQLRTTCDKLLKEKALLLENNRALAERLKKFQDEHDQWDIENVWRKRVEELTRQLSLSEHEVFQLRANIEGLRREFYELQKSYNNGDQE